MGSLIEELVPEDGDNILVYDIAASESGALSILTDFYNQVCLYGNKSIEWYFMLGVPKLAEKDNVHIFSYPKVKASIFKRIEVSIWETRRIVRKYKINKVFSLQNKGIDFWNGFQLVYLHLAFILTDYNFHLKRDGRRLWFYQKIYSRFIFSSLRKVTKVIVQTNWMKDALIKKVNLDKKNIKVISPFLSCDISECFVNTSGNRRRFFYPATPYRYKNHMIILEAFNDLISNKSLTDYELIFTLKEHESEYCKELSRYAHQHHIHVNFIGLIEREKVFELYASSVLLFPSLVESFGLPLLEARNAETYIIAGDCEFCKEIIGDYDRGYLYRRDDYLALARVMENLLNMQ